MSIYLMDFTTFLTLFEFDCEQSEGTELEVEWTEKPVETGSVISEYAIYKPETYQVEGIVTAWPLGLARDPTRIGGAVKALKTLAKRMLPVWLITDDISEEVVLGKVTSRRAAGEGEQATIILECRIIETTTPSTTTIPASKLKPSVKNSSALRPKKGASAGSQFQPGEQRKLDGIIDGAFPGLF